VAVRPGCTIDALPNGCTVTHSWLVAGGVGDEDGVGDFEGVGDCDGVGDFEGVGDVDGVGVVDRVGVLVGAGVRVRVGVGNGVALWVGSVDVPVGSGVAGGVWTGVLKLGDGLVVLTEGEGERVSSRLADSTAAAGRWAHALVAASAGLAGRPTSSRPDRPDVKTPIPVSAPTPAAPRRVLTGSSSSRSTSRQG
jgi:hypothetical protein